MYKIKVGQFTLAQSRDVNLPQEFAAWHQTVRVEPGTYDVFAWVDFGDGEYRVRNLAAIAEGVTVSSNFRSHMFGQWGKSDNNRNGQIATATICLQTYGRVANGVPIGLGSATLIDAIQREEWEPDSGLDLGRMWRLVWRRDAKIVLEPGQDVYSGGTLVARVE